MVVPVQTMETVKPENDDERSHQKASGIPGYPNNQWS